MHYKKCHNTTEYYGESFKKWLSQKIPIALINKCKEADQYNYCVTWSITSIPILKNQSKMYHSSTYMYNCIKILV